MQIPIVPLDAQALAQLLPHRPSTAYKNTFGHVVLVAGSPPLGGAAILAALGALRSGAGRVSWATDGATLATAPCRPPELMVRLRDPQAQRTAASFAAASSQGAQSLVLGPGLGTDKNARALTQAFLELKLPTCLDADGLTHVAAEPALWRHVAEHVVLTPHPGEMARLLATEVATVEANRPAAAAQVAQSRGCTVVLKGAQTVIADADGAMAQLVGEGRSALAHGGTGDVLAGLIGGLLAQGLSGPHAARLGVLAHALAADEVCQHMGAAGVMASDVAHALGRVWARR
jgi:NAD(P)H-hydrate epimerase